MATTHSRASKRDICIFALWFLFMRQGWRLLQAQCALHTQRDASRRGHCEQTACALCLAKKHLSFVAYLISSTAWYGRVTGRWRRGGGPGRRKTTLPATLTNYHAVPLRTPYHPAATRCHRTACHHAALHPFPFFPAAHNLHHTHYHTFSPSTISPPWVHYSLWEASYTGGTAVCCSRQLLPAHLPRTPASSARCPGSGATYRVPPALLLATWRWRKRSPDPGPPILTTEHHLR